jgi:hypothetical protein
MITRARVKAEVEVEVEAGVRLWLAGLLPPSTPWLRSVVIQMTM